MLISATASLLVGFGPPHVPSGWRSTPDSETPAPGTSACGFESLLPFAELEALARPRLPVLLAFLHARVAREHPQAPEERAQCFILAHQGAPDRKPQRSGLAAQSAAVELGIDVVLARGVRHRQGLEGRLHQRLALQVFERGAPVDRVLAAARGEAHTRHGLLAA